MSARREFALLIALMAIPVLSWLYRLMFQTSIPPAP